jgi:hypothetical protein
VLKNNKNQWKHHSLLQIESPPSTYTSTLTANLAISGDTLTKSGDTIFETSINDCKIEKEYGTKNIIPLKKNRFG